MTRPFNLGQPMTGDNTLYDEKSTTELADQDMKVFEEIRLEEQCSVTSTDPPHLVKVEQHHDQMLKNLQEVFNFIKQTSEVEEDMAFRPIKIISPAIPSSDFRQRISRRTSVEDKILNEATG